MNKVEKTSNLEFMEMAYISLTTKILYLSIDIIPETTFKALVDQTYYEIEEDIIACDDYPPHIKDEILRIFKEYLGKLRFLLPGTNATERIIKLAFDIIDEFENKGLEYYLSYTKPTIPNLKLIINNKKVVKND